MAHHLLSGRKATAGIHRPNGALAFRREDCFFRRSRHFEAFFVSSGPPGRRANGLYAPTPGRTKSGGGIGQTQSALVLGSLLHLYADPLDLACVPPSVLRQSSSHRTAICHLSLRHGFLEISRPCRVCHRSQMAPLTPTPYRALPRPESPAGKLGIETSRPAPGHGRFMPGAWPGSGGLPRLAARLATRRTIQGDSP